MAHGKIDVDYIDDFIAGKKAKLFFFICLKILDIFTSD